MGNLKANAGLYISLLVWVALFGFTKDACNATIRNSILSSLPFAGASSLTNSNCSPPPPVAQEVDDENYNGGNYGAAEDESGDM